MPAFAGRTVCGCTIAGAALESEVYNIFLLSLRASLLVEVAGVRLSVADLRRRRSLRSLLIVILLLAAAGVRADDWQTSVDLLLQRGFASLAEVDARDGHPARAEIEDTAAMAPE